MFWKFARIRERLSQKVSICCVIRAVSGLIPVLLSEWGWVNRNNWEGDGGSRLLLSFLKSVGRIIFFCEINKIRGAQHSRGFLLVFRFTGGRRALLELSVC